MFTVADMSSMMGTTWFMMLVAGVSFCLGIWWSDKIKEMLGR